VDRKGSWVGLLGRSRLGWGGLVFFFFFSFFFQIQTFSKPNKIQTTIEFKPGFESNNQKPCTSMYATVNSYISLIN
jgi:predicted lipid-binding transport protein (Tim44 family)